MKKWILIIGLFCVLRSGRVGAIDNISKNDFRLEYGATVALSGSGDFVRLTDPVIVDHFDSLTDALIIDDMNLADSIIDDLAALDVHYKLIRIPNATYDTVGFMEDRQPGESGYKGWGAVLINQEASGYVIYQAPHVFADMSTREICLQGFFQNPNAVALILTGAHRYANPDDDGDLWPDSDSAHDGDCLFQMITGYLAGRGVDAGTPYWFVQVHGSADRPDEPDIIGSNCDHEPLMSEFEPLVQIDEEVDVAGYVVSGVWGWEESSEPTQDGDYYLNGLGNIQRYLLSGYGVARSFLHYELERTIRDQHAAGSGDGFNGINHWLTSIESVLGSNFFVQPITPTPEPTFTPTPTPTLTETPIPTATPSCVNNGDINMDNNLTAEDAQIVFNAILGTYTPTVEEWCAGDCDGSGWLTSADCQAIIFTVLGMSTCEDSLIE